MTGTRSGPRSRGPRWPVVLLGLWLAGTAAAFGVAKDRWLSPFAPEETLVLFDGGPLTDALVGVAATPVPAERPRVLAFERPGCRCNAFGDDHRRGVAEAWGADVDLVLVRLDADRGEPLPAWLPTGSRVVHLAADHPLAALPSAPAAAVVANGAVAYLGPWSFGLTCLPGNGFVETVLTGLAHGEAPRVLNTMGSGCFCPFQPTRPGTAGTT